MPATTDTTRAGAHEMLAAVVRLCSRAADQAADQSADSSRADVLALSLGAPAGGQSDPGAASCRRAGR